MKKLLMAAAAALFAIGAASASPNFFIDGGITVPVYGNLDCDDGVDSDTLTSVGADVSFRAMFSEKLGLYANAGFYFPQERKFEGDGEDSTIDADDTDEWYGFNGLFGLAIMPVNKEKFGLTIAPGFAVATDHMKIDWGYSTTKFDATYFGIGANIGFDIYVADTFYLKPSVEADVFFAGDADSDDSTTWFACKPAFSLGWRF